MVHETEIAKNMKIMTYYILTGFFHFYVVVNLSTLFKEDLKKERFLRETLVYLENVSFGWEGVLPK